MECECFIWDEDELSINGLTIHGHGQVNCSIDQVEIYF